MRATVAGNDVCGNGFILRETTLPEAHGKIGSFHPVKVNGIPGHFEFASAQSVQTVFKAHDIDEPITTD